MEVPRLGVRSELELLGYTTATATPDPSCICDLHHSSQQHQILNPLSEARDGTRVLLDTSQVCYCWVMTGTPCSDVSKQKSLNVSLPKVWSPQPSGAGEEYWREDFAMIFLTRLNPLL